MTKQQIVNEISKRLNDPNAVAFADRIWGYFVETIYELNPELTAAETLNRTKTHSGFVMTNVSGIAKPSVSTQMDWNAIYSVNVSGVPARQIDQEEYAQMLSNTFYMPSGNEAAFYFDGNQLVILTGYVTRLINYTVAYLADTETDIGGIADDKDVNIPNSLVYRAMPIVVNKVKAEIGMIL